MNTQDFTNEVIAAFKKHFPNGYIHVGRFALGGGVYFRCGLIGDPKDCINGIRGNDIMSLSFGIHEMTQDVTAELSGALVLEFMSGNVSVNPASPYMVMSSVKIPARKTTAEAPKLVVSLAKLFAKAAGIVKAEIANNNLYGQDKIKPQYLEIN